MKSTFRLVVIALSLGICTTGAFARAAELEPIKNTHILGLHAQARADIDQLMGTPQFVPTPEALLLKASIYGALATDGARKGTKEGDQLTTQADVAFSKYQSMDPSMRLLGDPAYLNAPINIYTGYYTSAFNDYQASRWDAAYAKIKKAVEYSDLLIAKKILNIAVDAETLTLAGAIAEKSGRRSEAATYYGRLADHRVARQGQEGVYEYLVNYYFLQNDMAAFERYRALGRELYPQNKYFTYDKVDFAVGLATGVEAQILALEKLLAVDSSSYKANEVLGEVIFAALHPQSPGAAMPSDAAQLERKMESAFARAAAADPRATSPLINLGDHYMAKADRIRAESEADGLVMQEKGKSAALTAADVAKQHALEAAYGAALLSAKVQYEKAAIIFANSPDLGSSQKGQYQYVVGGLVDIADFNVAQARSRKAPDLSEIQSEQKKWSDLYESLK